MINQEIIFFILGLIGLWVASGFTIDATLRIAKKLNIPEGFLGLTLLSIGTSLPEIVTHIIASVDILLGRMTIESASAIAIGTNVGSNIIQITLIVGILGLLTRISNTKKILENDYIVMLGAIVLLFLFGINGINRVEGLVLVLLYGFYVFKLASDAKITNHNHVPITKDVITIIVGLTVLIFSAEKILTGAKFLASLWGVTESLVGILIIGVSTALPEFTTALRAIMKGSNSLSLGTLVGSNITNPMLAIGIGAMISGYTVDNIILFFDIPFWFFVSLILYFFLKSNMKLEKKEALFMICSYIVFVILRLNM